MTIPVPEGWTEMSRPNAVRLFQRLERQVGPGTEKAAHWWRCQGCKRFVFTGIYLWVRIDYSPRADMFAVEMATPTAGLSKWLMRAVPGGRRLWAWLERSVPTRDDECEGR